MTMPLPINCRIQAAYTLLGALGLGVAGAQAQQFPNKPINVFVHLAAGTSSDLVYRAVSTQMTKDLGQPIIVQNRPGANGLVAYEHVVRNAPADGYTIATTTN